MFNILIWLSNFQELQVFNPKLKQMIFSQMFKPIIPIFYNLIQSISIFNPKLSPISWFLIFQGNVNPPPIVMLDISVAYNGACMRRAAVFILQFMSFSLPNQPSLKFNLFNNSSMIAYILLHAGFAFFFYIHHSTWPVCLIRFFDFLDLCLEVNQLIIKMVYSKISSPNINDHNSQSQIFHQVLMNF